MSDGKKQFTLREWWSDLTQPVSLGALLGAAAFATLAAPFGTGELLSFVPRLFYWLVMISLTYSVGLGVNMALHSRFTEQAPWIHILATGLATSFGVLCVVLGLNLIVFNWVPDKSEALVFIATIAGITLLVTAALYFIGTHSGKARVEAAAAPSVPPLLERLPFEKRAPLVALCVEDHYVRVRTLKGEEMLLMRLRDAILEVGDTEGAQVHRSHWVAFGQVRSVRKDADRAILTMAVGEDVPVSRANVAKIKEAGLLPR